MYNKTMGCLECLAHGFKTMCKANIFLRIIQFCVFFLTHIFFLRIIKFLLFYCFDRQEDYNIPPYQIVFVADIYFGLLENIFFINKNKVTKVILFFILCYKISPIIFTITIIFCRHVTNVTNFTSRYKISPIIFTITIMFCLHVTHVTNITSRYKISPILGCRAPLDAMKCIMSSTT